MKILTVYAHPNRQSFCHAVLEEFTRGLKDAGHTVEVVDLYEIGFDPVLSNRDAVNWLPDENAPDVVDKMIREKVLTARSNIFQRLYKWFLFRNKTPMEIVKFLAKRGRKM